MGLEYLISGSEKGMTISGSSVAEVCLYITLTSGVLTFYLLAFVGFSDVVNR